MPARVNRRQFLTRARPAQLLFQPETGPVKDVLVTVFLRGAMDACYTVPPFADPAFHRQRPTLAVPDPGKPGGAIDLDGHFGLHPDLSGLSELFRARQLAVIHAIGSQDRTLSHFEAMQSMERGVDDGNSVASGWITRHLSSNPGNPSPIRGVAIGDVLPKSLQGSLTATAVRSLTEFRLALPENWPQDFRPVLAEMYADGGDAAARSGRLLLALLSKLERLDPQAYRPDNAAKYPEGDFGRAVRQVAQLIKADVGLEVAALEIGGWDAHAAQRELMAGLMKPLGDGLLALQSDLGDRMRRVTVVVMTEFGRRVHENSALGTDHGRGSAMFVLGGGVRGGTVYGTWPGLEDQQLDREGNLRVTTDYRDVLSEILVRRMGNERTDLVFPGHHARFLNLTA